MSALFYLSKRTNSIGDERNGFHSGQLWDGRGSGSLTQQDLEDFSDFPLFWFGPVFEGYNLQSANSTEYGAGDPTAKIQSWTGVDLVYGVCENSRVGGCPPPVEVHIHPICAILPESVPQVAKDGNLKELSGGALVQPLVGGFAYLWTSSAVVDLRVRVDEDLVNEIIESLVPLGTSARQGLKPSMPPDFQACI